MIFKNSVVVWGVGRKPCLLCSVIHVRDSIAQYENGIRLRRYMVNIAN